LGAILALEAAMATVVAVYYLWPAGSALLASYGKWQHANGGLGNGICLAIAAGGLSELSLVCFQQKGRWTWANAESLGFKMIIFFIAGVIVYYFYRQQAVWWGTGTSFSVILSKVLVDQFGYSVIFSAPYYAILTRWYALRYSGAQLWKELKGDFLTDRVLPVLVTNWIYWIPTVSFVYAMPTNLQPPLAAFATAIWGLLVAALGNEESAKAAACDTVALARPSLVAETVE
jgi:hypothetical protein